MAARAYWQGQIRLALVSIPVEIYPATKSGAAISFRQIHEPSGKPINYEKVVQGIGPVDHDDIVKGYEVSKGNFVLLEDDEIEAVKIESRKTLELVQFVDQHEIDVFYFEKPYYVVPADDLADEAFVVLREALRKTRKIALGQLSVRGREQLVSLRPCGKGIVLETLRYADEVKKAQSYFDEIPDEKPSEDLLDLATTLIDKKSAPFEPAEFHDRYIDALKGLIEKKTRAKGKKILEDVEEPTSRGSNVIDLMAALKRSVGSGGGAASENPAAKKAPAKKAAAKKDAPAKEPAKKAPAKKPAAKKTAEAPPARSRKRA
ncbi:DNA end-binding protein Ku [Novosphingobium chloroacetimidivorans]|uniref:Non-homologous end joining protein Ku n=1 Tax=Novosphingobium chloroacetimidivorans TaxID=1428314 RepID=A0A7W7K999_9SPHN|nr:Ku protein [Novosphingobium chloroacetimidivorans]MBB4858069.1 DNA end-binding protein Ku [Novosphingobium chloroacetimidivorans]